jgi:integrase
MFSNKLSAKEVAAFKDGKHRDGEGLQLEVKGGSRRWTFSYMWEGRQCEIALGKYPAMSLAQARVKRAELRDTKQRGVDPKTCTAPAVSAITFRADMQTFHDHMVAEWSVGHATEWRRSLNTVAAALMDNPTASITQADVLAVIEAIWATRNETATRVLGRIEQILDHAMAVDPIRFTAPNPCGAILKKLPRGVRPDTEPRAAMPWRNLPTFFAALRQRDEPASWALQLMLLACTPRRGEVMPATWGEIDGDRWTVPKEHMKSRVARTIPLTAPAIALLAKIKGGNDAGTLLFPSKRRGGSGLMAEDAMQVFLRDEMRQPYDVHGFRSSFTDWVADCHPTCLMAAERALDHKIGGKVQQAYLRTDLIDQRRELAVLWAEHLGA